MTKIKSYVFTTLVCMCFTTLQAQNDSSVNQSSLTDTVEPINANASNAIETPYAETETEDKKTFEIAYLETPVELHYSGKWMISAGINMVEDSGNQQFGDFFTFKHKNFGQPLMLNTEYLYNNHFSLGATLLFNKYQSGKEVQGNSIQEGSEPNYFAIDFSAKLFLRDVLHRHVFTPYVTAGPGYRYIGSYQAQNAAGDLVAIGKTRDLTLNAGLGAYYWIDRSWGINFNYIAKFAMKVGSGDAYKSNHLVSSLGVFYRFDTASR